MRKNWGFWMKLSTHILFAVSILTCIIVDLAVSGTASWSLYVIFSVILVWGTVLPITVKGTKGINLSLIIFTVLSAPFMLFLEYYTKSGEWFVSLFLPVYAASMAFIWCGYLLFRYSKINKLTLGAIFSFFALPLVILINFCVSIFTKEAIFDVWDLFGFLPLLAIGISFVVLRVMQKSKKKEAVE